MAPEATPENVPETVCPQKAAIGSPIALSILVESNPATLFPKSLNTPLFIRPLRISSDVKIETKLEKGPLELSAISSPPALISPISAASSIFRTSSESARISLTVFFASSAYPLAETVRSLYSFRSRSKVSRSASSPLFLKVFAASSMARLTPKASADASADRFVRSRYLSPSCWLFLASSSMALEHP